MVNSPAVVAEHTPNPDAIKFLLGRACFDPVAVGRSGFDFVDPADAASVSPLAAALLALDGVRRVFVGPDFVAVTRDPAAGWRELGARVIARIREFLVSDRPCLDAEAARAAAPPVDTDRDEDAARVRSLLENEIRPLVALHGGDVQFLGYADGVVSLALRGACAGCPASEATLRGQIETRLRAALPGFVRVDAR
ncbi:MAG: NifU family protein [Deltaproteobacteria bacterium]|nr:NifU family protein [Deltaproteobacteria bacterium]